MPRLKTLPLVSQATENPKIQPFHLSIFETLWEYEESHDILCNPISLW